MVVAGVTLDSVVAVALSAIEGGGGRNSTASLTMCSGGLEYELKVKPNA